MRSRFGLKSVFALISLTGIACYFFCQHKFGFPFQYSNNQNVIWSDPEVGQFNLSFDWNGIEVVVESRETTRYADGNILALVEISGAEKKSLPNAIFNKKNYILLPSSKGSFIEAFCKQVSESTEASTVKIVTFPLLDKVIFEEDNE